MKKLKYFLMVSFALALGVGVAFLLQNMNSDSHGSNALYKSYDTVSEIYNDSELVVKGKVVEGYQENERKLDSQTIQERIYKVEVKKVVQNNTSDDIQKGDIIPLVITMSAQVDGTDLDLNDYGVKKIESGNYLLFLNSFKDGNEVLFMNNSPNYLYRGNANKFENISGNDLEVITESEIINGN